MNNVYLVWYHYHRNWYQRDKESVMVKVFLPDKGNEWGDKSVKEYVESVNNVLHKAGNKDRLNYEFVTTN